LARLPVEIDVASEHRYREAPVDNGGLTIVVSQSGETADTLASLRYVKDKGSRTVGVVNVPDSSIARLTDATAPTLAGPEIGVASTKSRDARLAMANEPCSLARNPGRRKAVWVLRGPLDDLMHFSFGAVVLRY
jgi:glutamine---fructose-6-phosphate transaminase (isomerizing)